MLRHCSTPQHSAARRTRAPIPEQASADMGATSCISPNPRSTTAIRARSDSPALLSALKGREASVTPEMLMAPAEQRSLVTNRSLPSATDRPLPLHAHTGHAACAAALLGDR